MNTYTLTNLSIWDGDRVLDADTLVIRGDRIAAVGGALDAEGQTINCGGATAMPGLMDAHVHMELNPEHTAAPATTNLDQGDAMAERAAQMVGVGITTARDLGGGAWLELDLRDRIARGELPGPRLICSGQPVTCPRGHCHFWGGEAANIGEARTVMQRQIDRGVDLIKVMATGGRMTKGSDPNRAQFDLETLSEIVGFASGHDLDVAAHCHGTEGIQFAAAAGVTTIEHCSWVGADGGWATDYQDDVAALIAERDIWVSPTVNRGWQRMLDSKTGTVLGRVRTAYQSMDAQGIPMIASTDAGIPGVYHHHLPFALGVFGRITEFSNDRTLRSATSDVARALKIDHITGRLAPGLAADVLLLDGNPLEDLDALTRPVGVWARGRAITLP